MMRARAIASKHLTIVRILVGKHGTRMLKVSGYVHILVLLYVCSGMDVSTMCNRVREPHIVTRCGTEILHQQFD